MLTYGVHGQISSCRLLTVPPLVERLFRMD